MKSHELNRIINKINRLENQIRALKSMNISGSSSYDTAVVAGNYSHDHMPSSIKSGSTASDITFTGTITVPSATVTAHEGDIDHDALTNFVANEHIDWTSTSSSLVTSGDVTCSILKADTDTDHKIDMDAAADTIRIHPGDNAGDDYIILESFAAGDNSPQIRPKTHEWGYLGYSGSTAWYKIYGKYLYDDDGTLGAYDEHNDLQILDDMSIWKKDGEIQRDEDNIPLLDYNTIPVFLKGEIPEGKTKRKYIRPSAMAAFSWGCIKQLHQKVKDQQEIIDQLAVEIEKIKKS